LNVNTIRKEIKKLERAEADGAILSDSAEQRLNELRKALAIHETANGRIKDFRGLAEGTETEWGTVAVCPACGEHGARRTLKFWTSGNAVSFIHSVEAVPTIFELHRIGNSNRFTDDGVTGSRFRLTDDHHLIVDGKPVMKEAKAEPGKPVLVGVAKKEAKAKSRSAAALKAWETIRARRAAAMAA
jgi:hypothetical protein